MKRKQNIRWNTMKILVIGFLSVIVLGAVLLWLPVSNEKPISFLDALFTSTTSVCVTGLVTIVPKYQFTITGKIILLILIQIGGLGIIACITAFFMLLKRKITVKERIVIQEAYNMNSLGGLVGMVRRILFGTVVVEGIGAAFYAIQFSRDYGLVKGIWYGVFHSVSVHIFCQSREQGVGIGLLVGVDDKFVKVAKSAFDIVLFGQSQCGEIPAGSLQFCKPGNVGGAVAVLFSLKKKPCICRPYLTDDLRLTLLWDLRGGEHLIVVYNIASAATQIPAERQLTDHRRQTADGSSGVDK